MALDALIPAQSNPGRVVRRNSKPPYEFGDMVAVLFDDFLYGTSRWVPGMVLNCELPEGSRRFVAEVVIGKSGPTPVAIPRVYCWENGVGEHIRRLNEEDPGAHIDRLNNRQMERVS